jgi:hypothetical protein
MTSQITGGTGTNALASGPAGKPLGERNLASTAEHQHGIQGSGLTRETGQDDRALAISSTRSLIISTERASWRKVVWMSGGITRNEGDGRARQVVMKSILDE